MYVTDNVFISISKNKIRFDDFSVFSIRSDFGAVVSFLGLVRNLNEGREVLEIDYVVFDKLVYSILIKKCEDIVLKNSKSRIFIQFCSGKLSLRNINLFIAVSTINRKMAFLLCSELLDFIKVNAPIWKKEYYLDRSYKWLNS
ncbi:MAG TPA: molybdenum cofactor biosynthesis protein MoaE [Candidatus Azoamicus sp. OHIO1]